MRSYRRKSEIIKRINNDKVVVNKNNYRINSLTGENRGKVVELEVLRVTDKFLSMDDTTVSILKGEVTVYITDQNGKVSKHVINALTLNSIVVSTFEIWFVTNTLLVVPKIVVASEMGMVVKETFLNRNSESIKFDSSSNSIM